VCPWTVDKWVNWPCVLCDGMPIPNQHRKQGKGTVSTEGRGLGAVGCPAQWSVYQWQHSIQSHDTWSMWLMGKFKLPFERIVNLKHGEWSEQEVFWVTTWKLKSQVKKGHNSYLVIDVMTGFHNQLNSWVTSCSMAVSQTLSFCAEWDLATLG